MIDKCIKNNYIYKQKNILTSIFKHEITVVYPQCYQSVELYKDNVKSHVSHSTILFIKKKGTKRGN